MITAAHCAYERVNGVPVLQNEASKYKIEIGVQDTRRETDGKRTYKVQSILIHPKYKQLPVDDTRFNRSMVRQANHDHDIALIKLRNPGVEWSEYAQPICLPDSDPVAKTMGILVGWGSDKWGGKPTHELYKANMPIVSNSECNDKLNPFGNTKHKMIDVRQGHICAGLQDGKVDGCQVSNNRIFYG